MSAAPEISVVLPTFNRFEILRQAIVSVVAQTHTDWELIVADDGSAADARAALEETLRGLGDPRINVLGRAHSGNPGAVRTPAIARARGRYVAFIDSDDLWEPRKLETQMALMRARPERRWSYTRLYVTDTEGRPIRGAPIERWYPHEGWIVEPVLRQQAMIATPCVLAERTLLQQAGGFDEDQRYGEDYELWLRMAKLSPVSVTSDALTCVRKHAGNYSRDRVGSQRGWVRFYDRAAAAATDASLRALCLRLRGESALALADAQRDAGDAAAALQTLLDGAATSWRRPRWWLGALRVAVKPLVPATVRAAYRQARKPA